MIHYKNKLFIYIRHIIHNHTSFYLISANKTLHNWSNNHTLFYNGIICKSPLIPTFSLLRLWSTLWTFTGNISRSLVRKVGFFKSVLTLLTRKLGCTGNTTKSLIPLGFWNFLVLLLSQGWTGITTKSCLHHTRACTISALSFRRKVINKSSSFSLLRATCLRIACFSSSLAPLSAPLVPIRLWLLNVSLNVFG